MFNIFNGIFKSNIKTRKIDNNENNTQKNNTDNYESEVFNLYKYSTVDIGRIYIKLPQETLFSEIKYYNNSGDRSKAINRIKKLEEIFYKNGFEIDITCGIYQAMKKNLRINFATSISKDESENRHAECTISCTSEDYVIKTIAAIDKQFKKNHDSNGQYKYTINYNDNNSVLSIESPKWNSCLPNCDFELLNALRELYYSHPKNTNREIDEIILNPFFLYLKKKLKEKINSDDKTNIINAFNNGFGNGTLKGKQLLKISSDDRFICYIAKRSNLYHWNSLEYFSDFISDKIIGFNDYDAEERLSNKEQQYIEELVNYVDNEIVPNIFNTNIVNYKPYHAESESFDEGPYKYLYRNKEIIMGYISSMIKKYESTYKDDEKLINAVSLEVNEYFNKCLEDWLYCFINNNQRWLDNLYVYITKEEFISNLKKRINYKLKSWYDGYSNRENIRKLVRYCMAQEFSSHSNNRKYI